MVLYPMMGNLWNSDNFVLFWLLFILLITWSVIWKGIALWKAARNDHLGWFIALLIINTIGILEIIYILSVSKKAKNKNPL